MTGPEFECKMPGCLWTSRPEYMTTTGKGTRQLQTEKMQAADHRRTKGHDTRRSKDRPVAYPPKLPDDTGGERPSEKAMRRAETLRRMGIA